jgi:hypothetical protein
MQEETSKFAFSKNSGSSGASQVQGFIIKDSVNKDKNA